MITLALSKDGAVGQGRGLKEKERMDEVGGKKETRKLQKKENGMKRGKRKNIEKKEDGEKDLRKAGAVKRGNCRNGKDGGEAG